MLIHWPDRADRPQSTGNTLLAAVCISLMLSSYRPSCSATIATRLSGSQKSSKQIFIFPLLRPERYRTYSSYSSPLPSTASYSARPPSACPHTQPDFPPSARRFPVPVTDPGFRSQPSWRRWLGSCPARPKSPMLGCRSQSLRGPT